MTNTVQAIYDFIQRLYEKYNIKDMKIEYGHNDFTTTHIIRIDDDGLAENQDLLSDLFSFSHRLADYTGEWLMAAFPRDPVKFSDFTPVRKFSITTIEGRLNSFVSWHHAHINAEWRTSGRQTQTKSGQETMAGGDNGYYAFAA